MRSKPVCSAASGHLGRIRLMADRHAYTVAPLSSSVLVCSGPVGGGCLGRRGSVSLVTLPHALWGARGGRCGRLLSDRGDVDVAMPLGLLFSCRLDDHTTRARVGCAVQAVNPTARGQTRRSTAKTWLRRCPLPSRRRR